jgi:hypothetical protein
VGNPELLFRLREGTPSRVVLTEVRTILAPAAATLPREHQCLVPVRSLHLTSLATGNKPQLTDGSRSDRRAPVRQRLAAFGEQQNRGGAPNRVCDQEIQDESGMTTIRVATADLTDVFMEMRLWGNKASPKPSWAIQRLLFQSLW